jgi:hypothetical protein
MGRTCCERGLRCEPAELHAARSDD